MAVLKFYEAENAIEAQMLKDYLASHRIDSIVLGADLQSGAGELSALNFPTLWLLDERDLELARRRLAEFREGQKSGREAWVCTQCGESLDAGFDWCWKCGRERPEGD